MLQKFRNKFCLHSISVNPFYAWFLSGLQYLPKLDIILWFMLITKWWYSSYCPVSLFCNMLEVRTIIVPFYVYRLGINISIFWQGGNCKLSVHTCSICKPFVISHQIYISMLCQHIFLVQHIIHWCSGGIYWYSCNSVMRECSWIIFSQVSVLVASWHGWYSALPL